MTRKDYKAVHEFLNNHEWLYIPGPLLNSVTREVTSPRRVCKQCGVVQWTYRSSQISQFGDAVAWMRDDSSLATEAIATILKSYPDGLDIKELFDRY